MKESFGKYQGKVAVITGASSGIGKSIAIEFAKQQSNVVCAARNMERLQETVALCENEGVKAIPVRTDVASEMDCKNLMETTKNHFGRIDFLINNAGISMRSLFTETKLEVMKKIIDTNFWGMVYCSHYAINSLIKNKGWIVGISSIAGFRALPGRTAYSASKFAMNGFLEALRTENMKTGLKVLTFAPGFTSSNIRKTALMGDGSIQEKSPRQEKNMMLPGEVAKELIKALKNEKKVVILTKQGKLTVIVNKFLNSWMDKQVFKHLAKEPGSPF